MRYLTKYMNYKNNIATDTVAKIIARTVSKIIIEDV